MKDLTIIIPVHVFNEKLLKKAINSIPKNSKSKVVIVCPEDIANEINNIKLPNLNYEILVNTGETDVFTQINLTYKPSLQVILQNLGTIKKRSQINSFPDFINDCTI